jgi:hypothetical protein
MESGSKFVLSAIPNLCTREKENPQLELFALNLVVPDTDSQYRSWNFRTIYEG